MREETFDISSLENATKRLGEVLQRYNLNINDDVIRDSVIQRFEFTYSLVLKTLKKYFMRNAFLTEDLNQMTFNELVRTANQLNLLKSNLEKWAKFREMRNLTSHTYDEEVALKVIKIIPDFYEEVLFLIKQLRLEKNV